MASVIFLEGGVLKIETLNADWGQRRARGMNLIYLTKKIFILRTDRPDPARARMRSNRICIVLGLVVFSLLTFGCSRPEVSIGGGTDVAGKEDLEAGRGRIAFVGGDSNIYTITPDGGEPIPITSDAHDDRPSSASFRLYESPTWAPTTGALAYIELGDTDPEGRQASVHVAGPDASGDEVVYSSDSQFPFYLFWSTSGEQITFLANLEEREGLGLWHGAGGEAPKLLDEGQPYYWDWAPSGEVLFSHVGGSSEENPDGARFSLVRAGEVTEVGAELEVLSFQAPAYSPAGEHVLAVVDGPDSSGGLAMLTEAGELVSVLAHGPGPFAFDWAASGDYVAYVTGRSFLGNLVGDLTVLDVTDPGDPQRIETGAHGVLAFWWSQGADRLAYFVPRGDEEGPDQLISTRQQAGEMLFGIHVFDPESGESHLMTQIRPTRDLLQILPFYDQYQRSITFWSPDGEEFVYASEGDDGEAGIFVASATAPSTPRRIASGRFAVWSWK